MDLLGFVLLIVFAAFIAIPFLLMRRNNEQLNRPNEVKWYSDHLEFEGQTLRYENATALSFGMTHRKATTNLVWKTYDALSYTVNLSGIVVFRSHEAYKRWSSDAKQIANEMQREYQSIVANAYDKIVPVLVAKALAEMQSTGSCKRAGVTFSSDGKVSCSKGTYNARSLQLSIANGSIYLRTTDENTALGNPKKVYEAQLLYENACLIEPLLNLAKRL